MKVAVICFGFEPSKLRKQPWRYVHELIMELPDHGFELTVVSDVDRRETDGIPIVAVNRILGISGPTASVVRAIERVDPDVVVALVGPTSFIRPSTIASTIDQPTIGLFAGPIYTFSEVVNVGLDELYRHYGYLAIHLLGALVPDRVIRSQSAPFHRIITLTDKTRIRLRRAGVDTPISSIPPGIDDFDLAIPAREAIDEVRSELNPAGVPMILYFTSPLTLRGTDTLIEAFKRVRRIQPSKLVLLSRQDGGGLNREEDRLTRLAKDRSIEDSFELVPRNLTPEGVKAHLAAADIVALPFKIVLSSVPISLLESMAMGRPVVSTKVAGIPELIEDERQLVEPGDPTTLTRALGELVADGNLREAVGSRNRTRMQSYQRWDEARTQFMAVLEEHA